MGTTHIVVGKQNKEANKIDPTFVCSGCGKRKGIMDIRIMGPDTLHPPRRTFWCYNPLCISKQKLFNAAVQRELDRQGRKLIREARRVRDSELEEIAIAIYMIGKIEPIEKGM